MGQSLGKARVRFKVLFYALQSGKQSKVKELCPALEVGRINVIGCLVICCNLAGYIVLADFCIKRHFNGMGIYSFYKEVEELFEIRPSRVIGSMLIVCRVGT